MEFSNYIKELLFFNDCVVLPGFGGFITKYKPAAIEENQLSFTPPAKEIVFNSHLIHNDGLFINYVSIVNRIPYKEAKDIVSNFICNTYSELDKNNSVVFQEIGTFSYDTKHNICFEPEPNTNLLAEAYGLTSFHFPIVEQIEVPLHAEREIRDRKPAQRFLLHPLTKAVIIGVPIIATLTFLSLKTDIVQSLKEKYFSVNGIIADTIKTFRNYAGQDIYNNPYSVDASLSIMTNKYVALDYREPQKETTGKTQPVENKTTFADTTSVKPEIKPNVPEVKDLPVKKQTENTSKDIKVSKTQAKYYLIAGSFGNKDNAKALSKKFDSQGYTSEILLQNNGLYRVAIKSFNDREVASRELTSINSKNSDFTVWILSGK